MIKNQIKEIIEKAVKEIGVFKVPDFSVEMPKEKIHGDYSTNIALVLSKILKKDPKEILEELQTEINMLIKNDKRIERVSGAHPGFLNFYLSKEFFNEELKKVNQHFGKNQNLKNKKIIVEYTDTNILKEFHIGHLMSNAIGESLARVFEFEGAKVKRACYQSDVGLHIAKAIWGKIQSPNLTWGKAYAHGSSEYEKNKEQIDQINKKIYQKTDPIINKLYAQGRKESLDDFGKIYKRLGTEFDELFFESEVADLGKKIVEEGLKKGIFETGDNGAIIFKGEKVNLHTRVFINSEGLPTYEAKDLALAKFKYGKYKYDESVVITANEQNEYFKVMLAAMSQIFPDLAKKTEHIGHGMMRLAEGKMSSRTGNVITFESLLAKVEELVKEKIKERELSEAEKTEIIEKVAIGALKYSILKQSIGSDIVYDFEKSISFEGDSGPYLQYSVARANSILKKAAQEKVKASFKKVPSEIPALVKMMYYFPEMVEKAGKELEPHIIVTYLTELAREFNAYYAHHKIVDKGDEFSPYKVALVQAFIVIMKNGLWLLGIEAPEKM